VSESSKVLFGGQSEEKDPDAYDPEYKPVLAEPPPLIEVKTGEEDEQVIEKATSISVTVTDRSMMQISANSFLH